jgi:hypothetical protein
MLKYLIEYGNDVNAHLCAEYAVSFAHLQTRRCIRSAMPWQVWVIGRGPGR